MAEERGIETTAGEALTEDELERVVGGAEDPIKSIKGMGEN